MRASEEKRENQWSTRADPAGRRFFLLRLLPPPQGSQAPQGLCKPIQTTRGARQGAWAASRSKRRGILHLDDQRRRRKSVAKKGGIRSLRGASEENDCSFFVLFRLPHHVPRLRLGSLFPALPGIPKARAGPESGAGGGGQSKEARREGRRRQRQWQPPRLSCSHPSSIDARRRRRKSKQSKSTFDLLKQSSSHTNTLTCRCPRRPGRGRGRRGLPPCRGRWRGATWLRSRGVGFFKKRGKEKSGEEPVQERRFNVFVVRPRPSLSLFFFSFLLLSSPRQRSSFPFSFYVCFVLQVGGRRAFSF